jgi:hypothetical protein
MKNIILPKQQQALTLVSSQYNPLFVASKNLSSKKVFVYHRDYQVHPSVQTIQNWDEGWFGNYE